MYSASSTNLRSCASNPERGRKVCSQDFHHLFPLITRADALGFVEIFKQFVLSNNVFVSKRSSSLSVPVINLFSSRIILQFTKPPVSFSIFLSIFPHLALEIQKCILKDPELCCSNIFRFNRARI